MKAAYRERRLAPAEVRRVVRRAAELSEADIAIAGTEGTLTVDEIERACATLGLSANAVRAALADSRNGAPARSGLGARVVLHEDEVAGELPADRLEEIVDVIRAHAGGVGRIEVVGKRISWFTIPHGGATVVVQSRAGKTSIRVIEQVVGWPMVLGVMTLGALLAFISVPLAMAAARIARLGHTLIGAVAAGVAAVVLVAWWFFSVALARRRIAQREAFLDRLSQNLVAAVSSTAVTGGGARVSVEGDTTEHNGVAALEQEAELAEAEALSQGRRLGSSR
jgi:hypothetical protein